MKCSLWRNWVLTGTSWNCSCCECSAIYHCLSQKTLRWIIRASQKCIPHMLLEKALWNKRINLPSLLQLSLWMCFTLKAVSQTFRGISLLVVRSSPFIGSQTWKGVFEPKYKSRGLVFIVSVSSRLFLPKLVQHNRADVTHTSNLS